MRSVARPTPLLVLVVGLACAKPTGGEPNDPQSGAASGELRAWDEVESFAIYTPNPDMQALQQTKAVRDDMVEGRSTVQFCVEPDGNTSDVQTIEPFPDDPLIDQIFRDTVATWRFKPLPVTGLPGKVCTRREFTLVLLGPRPRLSSESDPVCPPDRGD
jgi:hypothetical protein